MAAVTAALVKELRERTGLGMMECKKALVEADGDIEAAIEHLRKSSGMKAAKKAGRTAADGAVVIGVADSGDYAIMLEINSETDFVARDDNFSAFADKVLARALANRETDVSRLMDSELEEDRKELVQKIGENISVRRLVKLEGDNIGSYVHGNKKIGALVSLRGGDAELARDIAMHVAAVNPQYLSPGDVPAEDVEKERSILVAQAQDSGKPDDIIEKMVTGRMNKYLAEISLTEQAFVKDQETTVGKLAEAKGAGIIGFQRFEVGEGIEKEEKDFASEVAEQLNG